MHDLPCRTRRLALAASVAMLLLSAASSVRADDPLWPHRHAPIKVVRGRDGKALRSGERQTLVTSTNWSGYVLPNFETGQNYTAGTATWIVPAVSFDDAPFGFSCELSSTWLGIGGYCTDASCTAVDSTLIQLGTEQDACSDGSTGYYAWYEKLPAFSKPIKKLTVLPGDTMVATLTCKGKCGKSQRWLLTMTDMTSGKSWKKTLHYKGSKLSMDLIEEAPSLISGIAPLADFDTAVFSQSTANSASANLSTGDTIQLLDAADGYGPTSNPSAPNSTLDGFEACWGANQTFTPCIDPFS